MSLQTKVLPFHLLDTAFVETILEPFLFDPSIPLV
jgi:hypothetical protein